jgi:hypothetical protein
MSTTVISHWSTLVRDFEYSAEVFYDKVEQAIKKQDVPITEISRFEHSEGGIFTAKREYLRVKRGKLIFDICAAKYGTSYFFSYWLVENRSLRGIIDLIAFAMCMLIYTIFASSLCSMIIDPAQTLWFWVFCPLMLIVTVPVITYLAGYYVSRSDAGTDDALLDLPYFGVVYAAIFRPYTYYRMDTQQMFKAVISGAVLEVVDEITEAGGIRMPSEEERKPIMGDFLKRRGANA